jgi:hypothetical protein
VKEIGAEDIDYKRTKMILEENAKGSKISRAVLLLMIGERRVYAAARSGKERCFLKGEIV